MKEKNIEQRLDQRDWRILSILQQEGRISNVELAKRVNLTTTPCLERVKRLERQGYIKGYRASVNAEKLGYGLVVFVQIRLASDKGQNIYEWFSREVKSVTSVTECYMLAGEFDYLLKVLIKDMKHFQRFMGETLNNLPGVSVTQSQVVMEVVKESQLALTE